MVISKPLARSTSTVTTRRNDARCVGQGRRVCLGSMYGGYHDTAYTTHKKPLGRKPK